MNSNLHFFYDGYRQYISKCTEGDSVYNWLQSHTKETGLETATSVVSVGAGDGTSDTRLIAGCMPALKSYIGLDSHRLSFKLLQENIRKLTTLQKTDLLFCPVEDFVGPPESVDVVLMIHMLYFFSDVKDIIARSMNWLKPGGRLIMIVDDIFTRINLMIPVPTLWYTREIPNALKDLVVEFKEYQVNHIFRTTGCDSELVDFALKRKATEHEVRQFLEVLPSLTERGSDVMKNESHVYVVQKY